jgi:hypothetical protein
VGDPRDTIPLPAVLGGINRHDESAEPGQAVRADNVVALDGSLRRRPGLRSFAHGPILRLPEGQCSVVTLDEDGLPSLATNRGGNLFDQVFGIIVFGSEPFDGIEWGHVNDAGPEVYTEHAWLRAEYWNDAEWVAMPWFLDQTRDAADGGTGSFMHPLARNGTISWHRSQFVDWTETGFGGAAGYMVRLQKVNLAGEVLVMGGPDFRIEAPGVRAFHLGAVGGLAPALTLDGAPTLVVAGDRTNTRGLEQGAQLGRVTRAGTETLHLAADEGGGIIDTFTWPRWRRKDAADAAYVEEAAAAVPTIGSTNRLRKGRQDYSWNDRQWSGSLLRSAITPIAPFVATQIVVSIGENEDHAYEHGWLLCTTAGGVALGEYVQIRDSTYDAGTGRTTLLVYPDFTGAPTGAARFAILSPPQRIRAVEYWGRDWPIRDNNAHTVLLETGTTRPYGTYYADVVAGPEFTWEIGNELRWLHKAAKRWSWAMDPATRQVLLTNGEGPLLSFDGERLRLLDADSTSTNAETLAGLIPETEAVEGGGRVSSALALRSAPPIGAFVTVWRKRTFVGPLPGRPFDFAYSEGGGGGDFNNIWPRVNQRLTQDRYNQPIRGFFQMNGRLFVFTPASIHEIDLVMVGDREVARATPRVEGMGFLSHHAVAVLSTDAGEIVVGPTSDGLRVFDGFGMRPVIDEWTQVFEGGVSVPALASAVATTIKEDQAYVIALTPKGGVENSAILWVDMRTGAVWPWSLSFPVTALATMVDDNGGETLLLGTSDGFVQAMCAQNTDDAEEVEGLVRFPPFRPYGINEGEIAGVMVTAKTGGSAQGLTFGVYLNRSGVLAAGERTIIIAEPRIDDEDGNAVRPREATWGDADQYWETVPPGDAAAQALYFSEGKKPTARLDFAATLRGHTVQVEISGSWRWELHAVELRTNPLGVHGGRG